MINDLKIEFSDILTLLENERDRTLLIEATPNVITEEFTDNLPAAIPGQLDLRYEVNQNLPSHYLYIYEGGNHDNQEPNLPPLPTTDSHRPALLPPREEDDE